MKYLLIFLISLTTCFGGYAQFNSFQEIKDYNDQNITTNGTKAITGSKLNLALNGGFKFFHDNYFKKAETDARFAFKNHTHPISSVQGLQDTNTNLRTDIEWLKANLEVGGAANISGDVNTILYRTADGAAGNSKLGFDPANHTLRLGNAFNSFNGTPASDRWIMSIGELNTYDAGTEAAIIVGYNNVSKVSRGAIFGSNNTANGSASGVDLDNSFIAGEGNNIQWRYSFAMGLQNQPGYQGLALGTWNQSTIGLGNSGTNHMLGNYLTSKYPNSVITGVSNNLTEIDARIGNVDSVAFAVGAGTDASNRKTAILVARGGERIWFPQLADAGNDTTVLALDENGMLITKTATGVAGESPLTFQAPLNRVGNEIGINVVGVDNGVITPTMKTTWDGKQDAITWANVTAASNKVTLGGTPTGSVKSAFSIDINESNLTLNNIGGVLGVAKGGLGSLTLTGNGGKYVKVNSGGTGFELATVSGAGIQSVVAGDNVTIDNTDPANPIINATAAESAVTSLFGRVGDVVAVSGDYNTSQVTENTNLYFTDARARAAISVTAPLTYNPGTGALGMTASSTGVAGYLTSADRATLFAKEPAITATTAFDYYRGDKTFATLNTAAVPESGANQYFTNARARGAISLTTTGTSGAASYNSSTGVLNIPQYSGGGVQTVTAGTNISITGTSTNPVINATGSSGNAVNITLAGLDACTPCQTTLPFYITDANKEGYFRYAGTVANQTTDNGVTRVVSADLKAYDRVYDGTLNALWFGMVPGLSDGTTRANNVAAFNAMVAVATDEQWMKIPKVEGKDYYTSGPLVMNSESKKYRLRIEATIISAGDGVIMEGFGHQLESLGEILGPNSGASDSASFAAYTNDGLYFRNCDKCEARVFRVREFKNGVVFAGESTANPQGTQYCKLWYTQIRGNYRQIYITTRGTTGSTGGTAQSGNWSNSNIVYGGQVGGGLTEAGGTFGIVIKREPSSNQGFNSGGGNPFNQNYFFHTGFEGLRWGIWAENADFNYWIGGRWEGGAVTNKIYLRESTAANPATNTAIGENAYANSLIGFKMSESYFTQGGFGIGTSLSGGVMLEADGNITGNITLPNSTGLLTSIAGDDSPSAFENSTHNMITLGGFTTTATTHTNHNYRYAMHYKRHGYFSDLYVPFELLATTVSSNYTVADTVNDVVVTAAANVALPGPTNWQRRKITVRSGLTSGTDGVTVSGSIKSGDFTAIPGGAAVTYEAIGSEWVAVSSLGTSLSGGGGGGDNGDISIGAFSLTGNANGLSNNPTLVLHGATRTTPGGIAAEYQVIGGTKRIENSTGGLTHAIELGIGDGNSEIEIARAGTTGNAWVSFQNAAASGSTQQWNMGMATGTSTFAIRNAQSASNVFSISASNGNISVGSAAPGTDKLTVNGTGKFTSTLKLAKGTNAVPPLLFDPTSDASLTVTQPGAMEFDGENFFLSSVLSGANVKQTILTNSNDVDITGDKTWMANPITPGKIHGTSTEPGMVLTTLGNVTGAHWARNEGGFLLFAETTAQTSAENLATVTLPANKGMEVEVIVIGKRSDNTNLWREHRIIGYATTASTSAVKTSTVVSAHTSDFTPAAGVSYSTGGGLTFTVSVSSAGTESVQWTAYIKVRPTFTLE